MATGTIEKVIKCKTITGTTTATGTLVISDSDINQVVMAKVTSPVTLSSASVFVRSDNYLQIVLTYFNSLSDWYVAANKEVTVDVYYI